VIVFNIELLLHSRLVKDTLSAVLTEAGFLVIQEQNPDNYGTILIIDFDDRDREFVRLHQSRGAKIVALADEADSLTMSASDVTPLSGVLTHELPANAFVQSLRRICSGERVFPDAWVHRQSLPAPSAGIQPLSSGVHLSRREREVLSYLAEGHSDKVIAYQLGMTEVTVKLHLKSLLCKIRVDNRTQATIWALTNLPEIGPSPRGFV
jgi:two-component system, NarL family, nitrate/nitrite response regulator NarL